ncbi:MAG: OB-fold domain-containing protein [Pseudomonadota bacterium]
MLAPNLDDPLTGPFWQAAAEGRLVMCWSAACNRAIWYPQTHCPVSGEPTIWRTLSGKATLLSWTVVQAPINPNFKTPYIPALVVPEDAPGVRLVTQIVGAEPDSLLCDMPLAVGFTEIISADGERYQAPTFSPAERPQASQ